MGSDMTNGGELFDFATFPALTTERLGLREVMPADAPDLFTFRSDAEEQKYNSDPMQTVSEAEDLIAWMRRGFAAQEMIQWAVALRETDQVIGLFGFNNWDRYHHHAEIGYDLARAYWGRRLASEALHAIVQFGFARMALHRIEAHTLAVNAESIRLLEKLGFQRDALRREYIWELDGSYYDSTIYGLLRRDYHPPA